LSRQAFHAGSGPIIVEVEATGPSRSASLKLALDTGATKSLIKRSSLIYIGFDPDQSTRHVQMMTGSAVAMVPIVTLTRLTALDQHRIGFPVIAHTLPRGSAVDGLLGLDFLRNQALMIDFRAGWIELS